jgi:outer membrane protein assembly factor BamB
LQSSPRSVAPFLVLETADTERHARVICGLDGLDGHERWRFVMEPGHFVPSLGLAADRGVVYAATTEGVVYAVRAEDGGLVWQRRVTHRHPHHRPPVDLRVVAGGGIVVVDYARPDLPPADGSRMTALDGQDGSERWVAALPHAPPWVLLWRRFRRSWRTGAVLLGADSTGVYVTEVIARSPRQPDWMRTVQLDRRSGRRRWSTRQAATINFAGHWGSRTSLALAGSMAYTVGERLSALDTSSGRTRWSWPLPSGEGIRPGPLVADEAVLCAAYDTLFEVHRVCDGQLLWQLVQRTEHAYFGSVLGMVLMGDAVYVVRGKNNPQVEAYNALTGELLWKWPHSDVSGQGEILLRGDLSWRMVGAGGILYVPGPKTLCAVRASDGEQLWQLPTGGLPALVALPG